MGEAPLDGWQFPGYPPAPVIAAQQRYESIIDTLTKTAADWRAAYRHNPGGWYVMLPWHMIEQGGGWEPFCAYFTGFLARLVQSGPCIIGFETTDPAGQNRSFTVASAQPTGEPS